MDFMVKKMNKFNKYRLYSTFIDFSTHVYYHSTQALVQYADILTLLINQHFHIYC